MKGSLEKRFYELKSKIEGKRKLGGFELHVGASVEERLSVNPMNQWHHRIVSEIDFCLQMQKYGNVDVSVSVDQALTVLEEGQERDGVLTDAVCAQAEQCLLPLSEKSKEYKLLLVGHAHIDMNWQWGYDETVAATVATFRTMLRLMEEYPEFCFSQSQASVYKIIEEHAPEMMPEIQKRIKEGRWEVTASSWVETDKNMPCLESLMNHIVYTKKYLKEHWEIDPDSLNIDFSPDTFGHSEFLPELDMLGGVKYYYHCRGALDEERVLYRWKAPSGQEMLMYREPYWYNGGITPNAAVGLPKMATLCGGLKTGLSVYGVGDHGGGPTRRDLNRAVEMQVWPVFPQICFGRMKDYFEAAESVREQVRVIEHEMNVIFTGCYTTQSRIKWGNKRTERALINAEKLSSLVSKELGGHYAAEQFESAWQKTLFTHFHDILTGSCVQDSREHAMGLYQEALSTANCRSVQALETLTAAIDTSAIAEDVAAYSQAEGAGVGFGLYQGNIPTHESGIGATRILHILNTTGKERHQNATVTVWDWPGDMGLMEITDVEGNPLPFECTGGWQRYWDHRYFDVTVTVTVPAYGYTTIVLKEKEPIEVTETYTRYTPNDRQHFPYEDIVLENEYIRATMDCRTGEIYSLIDKVAGKERLRAGERGGLRYIRAQKSNMSSWMIERYLEIEKLTDIVRVTPVAGKLCSGLEIEYNIKNSRVITRITLGSEEKFLKVKVNIDWKEESRSKEEQPVLSYYLPLQDTTGQMLCDVPGGAIWRKDQEIDVPCLNYGAPEFSDGRVLALVSESKYGFRLSRGDLFLTLINTAHTPDPYPERGMQAFSLYLVPCDADKAKLAQEAESCLNPLQYVTNGCHKGTLPTTGSLLETFGESVVFTGVAQRDNCLTVRMYEAAGENCPVTVKLYSPVEEAKVTDLFGNDLGIPVSVDGNEVRFAMKPYTQAELRIVK